MINTRVLVAFLAVGLALIIALYMWIDWGGIPIRVDTGFASSASLKASPDGEPIEAEVTDADDVKALRRILSGWAVRGIVACGFIESDTITLSNDEKSMTFQPALSGDRFVGIEGRTQAYLRLSDEERRELDEICRKYGVDFVR